MGLRVQLPGIKSISVEGQQIDADDDDVFVVPDEYAYSLAAAHGGRVVGPIPTEHVVAVFTENNEEKERDAAVETAKRGKK